MTEGRKKVRVTEAFVGFLTCLAERIGADVFTKKKLGISRNTLSAWRNYAEAGIRKAEFRKVLDALRSLQIGPDEGYLEHWFEGKEVSELRHSLQGEALPKQKWWYVFIDDPRLRENLPPVSMTKDPDYDAMARSGVINAFRIKVQDPKRIERVTALVSEEARKSSPLFRLSASSGYNYLHNKGIVWANAGLGEAIDNGARLQAVLQSPFSVFAYTRAVANHERLNQWSVRQMKPDLERLQARENVEIKVTGLPINCSLFFTSDAVFYDPYLWGSPDGKSTENNFWVFEFGKTDAKDFDCYQLLTLHFDFLWKRSVPLGDVLRDYRRKNQEFEKFMEECVTKPEVAATIDEVIAIDLISRIASKRRR